MSIEGAHTEKPEQVEVVIAVALREEAACVQAALKTLPGSEADRVAWLRTGMGTGNRLAVREYIQQFSNLRLIGSSGFCGGLCAEAEAGTLVLANRVCETEPKPDRERFTGKVREEFHLGLEPLIRAGKLPVMCGVLLSVPEPLFHPDEKKKAAKQYGAHAVDMESAMLGRIAEELGKIFMVLRSVSDGMEDALPKEAGTFLNEQGRVRMGKVLAFAARHPRNIGTLKRLKERADLASEALRKAWEQVLMQVLTL